MQLKLKFGSEYFILVFIYKTLFYRYKYVGNMACW
jgi:hypothetical protein